MSHRNATLVLTACAAVALSSRVKAQDLKPYVPNPHAPGMAAVTPAHYGPYSANVLRGGVGLEKPLPIADPVFSPEAAWTLTAWVEVAPGSSANVAIAGVGLPNDADSRLFVLTEGVPGLRLSRSLTLRGAVPMSEGWHLLTATYSNTKVSFYVDSLLAGSSPLDAATVRNALSLAPVEPSCTQLVCPHFGGRIAQLTLRPGELSGKDVAALFHSRPDFELVPFEDASKPWPIQTIQYVGHDAPQDPSMMPEIKASFSTPVISPPPPAKTMLQPAGDCDWVLTGGWMLAEAPNVTASGEEISTPSFRTQGWMPAIVPGTVLTSMIAAGRYPDPDFGLNNLAIPEKLARQDYWYRTSFEVPGSAAHRTLRLSFNGINYHAEVWLNGKQIGEMTGAFERGVFDIGSAVRIDGPNALAVRVSPAPHPGVPNVQSIALGSGLNGGAMALDGPTFMATEGWDWFPPMHDRDTGLWQDVHLVATDSVTLGDVQVVTHLPLPDISQAEVILSVPLKNKSNTSVSGTLAVQFEGVTIHKNVTVAPGETTIKLTPAEFTQLHLAHPRLWWPNGYGTPELYHLRAEFSVDGKPSATQTLRFGVREFSYELSLLDNKGDLSRLEYDPTLDREAPHSAVSVTHEAMRQVPGGWASSVAPHADQSPALHPVADARATPDLILRVNGVRIAVRGGSWGMEDTRKRISREHLEPFFRLDKEANVNIIRNWQGQNTEPVFYDLADEYGMLVWNDFWEVTQDSNAEAGDSALFLRNAADTIQRYRSHPSIAMWCGRNEGVPQPAINDGMIKLTHELDGTRYYTPSSNRINLEDSGPYSYENPADYYTKLDRGFAVEVGTPSLPTLEWFHRWLPKEDRWPISDDWAYHNWHPHSEFTTHMQMQLGASDSLEEYERKAQMMNYVDYRAIFEGFNQHLWAPNGGRLLWMTQPAWPSMLWGIISSDYDTQASYYGTKKACEPLHVQMDLSNGDVAVVNTTRETLQGATLATDVYSLTGKALQHTDHPVRSTTDDISVVSRLDLAPLMADGPVLVRLELRNGTGKLLSRNLYWQAAAEADYRALNTMPQATVSVVAHLLPLVGEAVERTVQITLKNQSQAPTLETKLVLEDSKGNQLLPVYFSDNYISLLPGEEQTVNVQMPADQVRGSFKLALRGWNQKNQTIAF
ncbi:MAG: glycosyl hydrolase 2 galactose-binding domain-containing protein [Janthinobacterium lividum]